MNQRILIIGGPGAGKSTLLAELAARGYPVVPDSAREHIKSRKARDLSPRPPPAEFAQAILQADIAAYRAAAHRAGRVFFERGIPDALGMLDHLGLLAEGDVDRYAIEYPYFRTAFILPPWQQIYRTDDERDQTFAESQRVHDWVRDWYLRCGYRLVEVPRASAADRGTFVLDALLS